MTWEDVLRRPSPVRFTGAEAERFIAMYQDATVPMPVLPSLNIYVHRARRTAEITYKGWWVGARTLFGADDQEK